MAVNKNLEVSVVIPAYNEEQSIIPVIHELRRILEQATHASEIIVVDDASTDTTQNQAETTGVKVISHKHNKGYGKSIKDGIREARYEYILIMDADGQHNPQDVLKLFEYAEEYDMVVGARATNGSDSWRLPGKWFLKKLCNYLSRTNIPDVNSGLRIFKKDVMEQYLHLCSNGFSFTTSSTLAFLSDERDIKYVNIVGTKRAQGKSHVTLKTGLRTILLVLQIIMVFHPLRFFIPIAMLVLVYGILFSLYGIFWYHSFPRTGILAILAGINIFCFGLVADQIAKLRIEFKAN